MRNLVIFFLLLVFLEGCETKPKDILITQENVVDVLTKYGQANPENEVLIETKHGNIRLRLFEDTPLHRANFVKLIKEGFYDDDANFYRIVFEFMIQGGDLKQNLTYRIPAEFHQKYFHRKGALSMARVSENNPAMQSSASDFFIIHGGRYTDEDIEIDAKNLGLSLTPEQKQAYITEGGYMELDQKYTVFGEVTEGLEVVDKIASEKVFEVDKPLKEIPFKISLIEKNQAGL
jgi:cyclophilin family peptidyl-prolyl cis-trans isomerase